MRMGKKGLLMTAPSLMPILVGGLKGGLSVALVEMALQVPRKNLNTFIAFSVGKLPLEAMI